MTIRRFSFAVAVAAFVLAGGGERAFALFKCEGLDGKHTYVSDAEQCLGAYKDRTVEKKVPAKKSGASSSGASSTSTSGSGKISSRKQRTMDEKRREILEYELASETRKQLAFRELLTNQSLGTNKRHFFIKQHDEHARNVTAIRRELAKLPPVQITAEQIAAQKEEQSAQKEQQRQVLVRRLKQEASKQFALRQLIGVVGDDAEKRAQLIEQHDFHTDNIIVLRRQLSLLGRPAADSTNADYSGN